MEECCVLVPSGSFFYTPLSPIRNGTGQSGLSPSVSFIDQEEVPQACHQSKLVEHLKSWNTLFSDDPHLCQVTKQSKKQSSYNLSIDIHVEWS